MSTDKKAVGLRVKKVRNDEGKTQTEFGKDFDTTWQKIKNIEAGRDWMDYDMLVKFPLEHDTSLKWLLGGIGKQSYKAQLLDDLKECLEQNRTN